MTRGQHRGTVKAQRAIDPICAMFVDPAVAVTRRHRDGRTYYFCAVSCAEQFDASPEDAAPPAAAGRPADRPG